MFKTIFVADEGGRHGRDALRLARYLATPDTRFVIGSLTSPIHGTEPPRCEHADLIVVGKRRYAARILDGSPIPVAVAPLGLADGVEDRLRVIGVGFDAQSESRFALRMAAKIALEHRATMRVFAVVPPNDWSSSRIEPTPAEYRRLMRESLGERLREDVETLDSGVRAAASVLRGDPVETLTERTREGLDLLVVGSRGYGPLRRIVLGSVSSRLIERAECAVLVFPRTPAESERAAMEPAKAETV